MDGWAPFPRETQTRPQVASDTRAAGPPGRGFQRSGVLIPSLPFASSIALEREAVRR